MIEFGIGCCSLSGRVRTKDVRLKGSNVLFDQPIWIKEVERALGDNYGRLRRVPDDTGHAKPCPSGSKLDFLKTGKPIREWVGGVEQPSVPLLDYG